MGTTEPGGSTVEAGIFAIAGKNERMHLYLDVTELRTSIQSITDGGLEFFDVRGHRLAPIFDPKWTLIGLTPAGRRGESTVRRRLTAVVASLGRSLEQQREELTRIGAFADGAAPPLPDVADADLAVSFDLLMRAGLGHRPRDAEVRDVRDFWHNFWAHGLR